jgi:hypothetical protein
LKGYDVHIAASSAEPTSITIAILEHLAFDPLCIFDLGGMRADDPANPNVMYELGVRHAFRKPSVVLAWEHQRIPFDVSDQRAVKISRNNAYHFREARDRIAQFAKAAVEGQFYDPLESLSLRAMLDASAASGGNETANAVAGVLSELVSTVDALRAEVAGGRLTSFFMPSTEMSRGFLSAPPLDMETVNNLRGDAYSWLRPPSVKKADDPGNRTDDGNNEPGS